ncbi:MAG: hypothetical protein AB7E29_04505 [Xanthobacter sp.]
MFGLRAAARGGQMKEGAEAGASSGVRHASRVAHILRRAGKETTGPMA